VGGVRSRPRECRRWTPAPRGSRRRRRSASTCSMQPRRRFRVYWWEGVIWSVHYSRCRGTACRTDVGTRGRPNFWVGRHPARSDRVRSATNDHRANARVAASTMACVSPRNAVPARRLLRGPGMSAFELPADMSSRRPRVNRRLEVSRTVPPAAPAGSGSNWPSHARASGPLAAAPAGWTRRRVRPEGRTVGRRAPPR